MKLPSGLAPGLDLPVGAPGLAPGPGGLPPPGPVPAPGLGALGCGLGLGQLGANAPGLLEMAPPGGEVGWMVDDGWDGMGWMDIMGWLPVSVLFGWIKNREIQGGV